MTITDVGIEPCQAIGRLIHECSNRVDFGRSASAYDLFFAEGRVRTPTFILNGPDKRRERFSARMKGASRVNQQYWTNSRLAGDDARAQAVSDAMTVVMLAGRTTIVKGGRSINVVPISDDWALKLCGLETTFEDGQTELEMAA